MYLAFFEAKKNRSTRIWGKFFACFVSKIGESSFGSNFERLIQTVLYGKYIKYHGLFTTVLTGPKMQGAEGVNSKIIEKGKS